MSYKRGSQTVAAIDSLDLQVKEQEFVAIVGPSGCGKSSLLRIIGGLMQPTSGSVRFAERDTPFRANMVFQNDSLLPWRKTIDNVALGLQARGIAKAERRARAMAELEKVGLAHAADQYPRELSGGMRQRANLARAFANGPHLLLMDEPFAALDVQNRSLMQEQLLSLWSVERRTVLFVTHSIDEALLLADRVLIMSRAPGRFIAEYQVPFERPRDAQALRFRSDFVDLDHEISSVVRQQVIEAGRSEFK